MESLSTRTSLLSRVRNYGDHEAWREFENRYRELLVRFCHRRGLQRTDAEDVVQTVFAGLAQALPNFTYHPQKGRFRDYLFRATRNGLFHWSRRPGGRELRLDTSVAGNLTNPDDVLPEEAAAWEDEWVDHHYRLAMETLRALVDSRTIEVFERLVAGETVASVAHVHEMTVDAVHKIKQRMRDRMQELVAAQIAEEDVS